ncbi:MAG: helix-turn-helix transcriptional regulator, partial [Saezia sp.]
MSFHVSSDFSQEGFIRVGALAKMLGIATITVWRWSANGKLPKPVKLSDRVTAWRCQDIQDFINSR